MTFRRIFLIFLSVDQAGQCASGARGADEVGGGQNRAVFAVRALLLAFWQSFTSAFSIPSFTVRLQEAR